MHQLQKICDNDFISVRDFNSNPHRIYAAHEIAGLTNPSMATKMTVQFNLFGGTVFKLGIFAIYEVSLYLMKQTRQYAKCRIYLLSHSYTFIDGFLFALFHRWTLPYLTKETNKAVRNMLYLLENEGMVDIEYRKYDWSLNKT